MTLSVLSLLARQDVDPWQEADRLAHLSKAQAISSLAAKIWKSNNDRWSPSEASVLAVRLIDHGITMRMSARCATIAEMIPSIIDELCRIAVKARRPLFNFYFCDRAQYGERRTQGRGIYVRRVRGIHREGEMRRARDQMELP